MNPNRFSRIASVNLLGRLLGFALLLLGLAASPAQAQKTEAETTTAKQDTDAAMLETLKAMQKELQEIKALLSARPIQPQNPANQPAAIPQVVSLDLSDRPFLGDKNAPVTMVEITDYQCPFCSRHALQTMPQIKRDYIETGKVKYYVIDLPLEAIHPNAFRAAIATRCAGEQGKYWESHDWLFANQKTLTDWDAQAAALGLDAEKFEGCVTSDKYTDAIRKDIALSQSADVQGTPGFFFASGSGAEIKTSSFVNGARPFPTMKEQIDALLTQAQRQPQPAENSKGGAEQ